MSHERIEYYSGYESWGDHIDKPINTDKDNLNLLGQSALNIERERLKRTPPLDDFLEHQKVQYALATENGRGNDARWKTLDATTTSVEKALIDGCNSEIAMKSIALGQAIEALQYPTYHIQKRMNKALISKTNSEQPFKIKNQRLAKLKECAQSLAKDRWSEDINKELRMMDMCHAVWSELVDAADDVKMRDALPDRPELLKNWIRPVAPDWAKKRGAPKK